MSDDLSQPDVRGPQAPQQSPEVGQFASQPGTEGSPQNAANLKLVADMVRSSRLLAQNVPGATDLIKQINDLVRKVQMKILQSGGNGEVQAPPIG